MLKTAYDFEKLHGRRKLIQERRTLENALPSCMRLHLKPKQNAFHTDE
jgi:hypothetical protein